MSAAAQRTTRAQLLMRLWDPEPQRPHFNPGRRPISAHPGGSSTLLQPKSVSPFLFVAPQGHLTCQNDSLRANNHCIAQAMTAMREAGILRAAGRPTLADRVVEALPGRTSLRALARSGTSMSAGQRSQVQRVAIAAGHSSKRRGQC